MICNIRFAECKYQIFLRPLLVNNSSFFVFILTYYKQYILCSYLLANVQAKYTQFSKKIHGYSLQNSLAYV